MANERHIAKEIRDEYVETMSKIYYSYFKSYTSRLMKLQVRFHFSSYKSTQTLALVPFVMFTLFLEICILYNVINY